MPSPSTLLSKLSLESSMPPTTRSQSQQLSSEVGGGSRDPENDSDHGDDDFDEETDGGPVRSPTTNLSYNIDSLEDHQRETIRELFRLPSQEETPQMTLEWCGFSNDPNVYVFKMHEVVQHAIRIGSPTSRIPLPQCNCMEPDSKPCRHLIWLMDLLTKLSVTDHNPDEALDLDGNAFPEKLGSPYSRISDFHIDVLADSLHCDFGPSDEYAEPNPQRVREIREILAAIEGIYDESVDSYRPEYFDVKPIVRRGDIVSRGDLEYTILRLLISNDEFFSMFLKLLSPQDKARDPYRKLKQRVERVLNDLNEYSAASAASHDTKRAPSADLESPRNVAWAAFHITGVVQQIHVSLSRSEPTEPWERASAARALVWILKTIVEKHSEDAHDGATQDERNLYQRLIGNARPEDGAFIIDTLQLIPDQNQHIDELENIKEEMGRPAVGFQPYYMRRLEGLIAQQRKRTSTSSRGGGSRGAHASGSSSSQGGGAGSKRSAAHDRAAKRVR